MEITVASWNMLNAFGDPKRADQAVDLVKSLAADVFYASEMTLIDDIDGPVFRAVQQRMQVLGYVHAIHAEATHVIGERNVQTTGLWAKSSVAAVGVQMYGKRYGLTATIPAMDLTVAGLHADDRFDAERIAEGRDIISHWQASSANFCLVGDLNNMHAADPAGARLRLYNRLFGWIEVGEYYDEQKPVRRYVGKRTRTYRMAGGKLLGLLESAGLHDVDNLYQPTFNMYGQDCQLDHIMVSQAVKSRDFTVHNLPDIDEGMLSDHKPISAVLSSAGH